MKEADDADSLRDVLSRFPDSGRRIRALFQQDEQFRELCGDYGECLLTLSRLRGQGSARDDQIEQYVELRLSLEQELRGRIVASAPG